MVLLKIINGWVWVSGEKDWCKVLNVEIYDWRSIENLREERIESVRVIVKGFGKIVRWCLWIEGLNISVKNRVRRWFEWCERMDIGNWRVSWCIWKICW